MLRQVHRLLGLAAAVVVAGSGLSGPAWAQDAVPTAAATTQLVSLEAVATAVETGDLATLRQASQDQQLLGQLAISSPDTLIEFQLALAQAYADAGLRQDAIEAYQQALISILRFRGQGDLSMAEPMEEIARLAESPSEKARWFSAAFDIRERVWGGTNPNLVPYREQANAARQAVGQAAYEVPEGVRAGEINFDLVDVFYATHRQPTGQATPADAFGGERGPLSYGTAQISVPRERARGEIPRPSIWSFEFRADPNKHMILNSVTPIADSDRFFADVARTIDGTRRREAFVFVHGYNTSFEGALIRTAQLAVDMNLDGAPILYSWPSRASLLGYAADTRTVADAQMLDDVAAFLTQVAERTGAERVHLVAHSMGNRVLMRALDRIAAQRAGQRPLFDEVVLAAADVGVDEFSATLPRITPTGQRFTLYASARDRALQVSEQVNRMRRAGDARTIMVADGLQTIDTTTASGGLLGHDDFAGSALADFRAVMWLSLAPQQRCVLETAQADNGGRYWAFGSGCPETEFDEATQLVRAEGTVDRAFAKLRTDLSAASEEARAGLIRKRDRLAEMFGITPTQTEAVANPAVQP